MVAPHAGVWIEIMRDVMITDTRRVAPHAGVWIEITDTEEALGSAGVAPHAGVWIEIRKQPRVRYPTECRSPCGSVD